MIAEAAQLEFQEADHTYRLNGRVLPSVTQIIRAVLPGWEASEWYLQRGRALHVGCELLARNRLHWPSVHPEIEPRLRALEKFLKESGAVVLGTEVKGACEKFQFAGKRDGDLLHLGERVTVDWKSTICPQVIVQLGGYWWTCPEDEKPTKAVAVELRDDATYRCEWIGKHELRRAAQMFLNCLSVYGFMQAHNLKWRSANGN